MRVKYIFGVDGLNQRQIMEATREWDGQTGPFSDVRREFRNSGEVIIEADVASGDLPDPALDNLASLLADKLGIEPIEYVVLD